MSIHGLAGDSWLNKPATKPPLAPYDYLTRGPGLIELQRIGKDAAVLLASGKQGSIEGAGPSLATIVAADPIIAAIWGARPEIAALFGLTIVNTMVYAERKKTSGRATAYGLSLQILNRVKTAMLNNGDPSLCMIDFQESWSLWQPLHPALQMPNGSWCVRDLVLAGGASPCQAQAVCAETVDAQQKAIPLIAPAPPRGAITMPPSAKAITPPPTRAQIDADIRSKMAAACPPDKPKTQYCGESFEQLNRTQELSELALYLGAMVKARVMITMALQIPTNSTDAAVWKALADRGVPPAEAIDWFAGCDADLDCFRQRMNTALGRTDTNIQNSRSKTIVALAATAAAAIAFVTWRNR